MMNVRQAKRMVKDRHGMDISDGVARELVSLFDMMSLNPDGVKGTMAHLKAYYKYKLDSIELAVQTKEMGVFLGEVEEYIDLLRDDREALRYRLDRSSALTRMW